MRHHTTLWAAVCSIVPGDTPRRLARMDKIGDQAIKGTHPTLSPVYHPRFTDQIIGWVEVDPSDWYAVPQGDTEGKVRGPFATKAQAMKAINAPKSRKLRPSVYAADGVNGPHLVLTRAAAEQDKMTEVTRC